MDLSIRTESFGQDDQTWLGSSHGTDAARSVTLDKSMFTAATHYPDGFFLSGLPIAKITATTAGGEVGKYGPYDNAATDGRETLAGLLLTAVKAPSADSDPQGALLVHGVVVTANLPIDASAAAADVPMILFV